MRCAAPALLATILLGLSSIHAQTPPQPQRGPDGSARTFVPGVEVYPFPGLPFSGKDTIVWTRSLATGGTITTYVEANVARDSQGRVYRERHNFSPAGVNPQSTLTVSYVLDPIARTRTVCIHATHHCTITLYRPLLSTTIQPVGPFDNGQRFLTRESLGNQTMDDLPVIGTREKTSIAPGVIGNDQAVTLSREFWYSADLKTNLAVTRNDPREGIADIHLIILSRNEPDPTVFAVPPGFTVDDNRNSPQPLR